MKEKGDPRKAWGIEKSKKQNGTIQTLGCIPKKARSKKLCQLCKTHGGVHLMHNTLECHKYWKDGTAKGLADKKETPMRKGRS